MNDAFRSIAERFGAAFDLIEPHLNAALASVPGQERSLIYLERLLEKADTSLLNMVAKNPRVIESLVTIFSGSQFLTEIILRNPETLNLLRSDKSLTQRKSANQVQREVIAAIASIPNEQKLDVIRCYQRGEILRIGASDLLALYDLRTVTQQLSNLADGLVRACLDLASEQSGISAKDFVVIAMGKHG